MTRHTLLWEVPIKVAITNALGGEKWSSQATILVQEHRPRLRLALHEILPHGLGAALLLHVCSEIPRIKSLHSTAQRIVWRREHMPNPMESNGQDLAPQPGHGLLSAMPARGK